MSYKIAIDGGASTTRLSVINERGERIEKYETQQGSNPYHCRGPEKPISILSSLIERVGVSRDLITDCLAAISGCQGSPYFNPIIKAALEKLLPYTTIRIEGDIRAAYFALNPAPYGVLGIAGSGSSMAILHPDSHLYVYDGVSYGGRDAAIQLLSLPMSRLLQAELREKGSDIRASTPEKLYKDPALLTVAKLLPELEHHTEIMHLRDSIAARWTYKLWGAGEKIHTRDAIPDDETVHIVLGGNFWRWESLRQAVITGLATASKPYQVHYNPAASSLHGVEVMLQNSL